MTARRVGSLPYALARLAARHGQRPDETAWRRIEGLRGFAPALEEARRTALRAWLVGITADSGAAQVEATLRQHARAWVHEVADWMDPAWREAIVWCALLPDLAALQHVARGGAAPDWLADLPEWRALDQPDTLGEAWFAQWQQRLPRQLDIEGEDNALPAFAALLRQQLSTGLGQRAALRAHLTLLLRRATLQPAAVFIHLALSALDWERLRAELLRRAWFPNWKVA
jgi:hypothetical protein